jgi:hypothetical protein
MERRDSALRGSLYYSDEASLRSGHCAMRDWA